MLFQLLLEAVSDIRYHFLVPLGGAGHDLVEIPIADQIAVAVAGGVKLGRAAKVRRGDKLVIDRAAQLNQVFTIVDANGHLSASGNAKGSFVASFQGKNVLSGPISIYQS